MSQREYYNMTAEETASALGTDIKKGLSTADVEKIREESGYNEFKKTKHKSLAAKFFDQFKSFMIIVLIAAAAISGAVGYIEGEGFTDAVIIMVIVLLNACIGVVQEAKAERSLEALEKLSSPQSKVMRDGHIEIVESREIVPGDIVVLDTGDAVPADLRLFEVASLKMDEAALTGESVPSEKETEPTEGEAGIGDQENMAFAATSVSYGRGRGIVTTTGMNTEMGKIAAMIQSAGETKTPLQVKLDKLGKILAIAAIIICGVIFLTGVLYGRSILDMFMIAVSLAAAAIPEGLPAVSTIVLAVGVQRLVKRHAIVRKLPSVETLGSTQVICSDKTGTLTQNKMTVVQYYCDDQMHIMLKMDGMSGAEKASESHDEEPEFGEINPTKEQLVRVMVLANDAKEIVDPGKSSFFVGDPTETALLDLGIRAGINKSELEREFRRKAEVPFDSERKMMSTVNQTGDGFQVMTKGGLDEILARSTHILKNGKVELIGDTDIKNIKAVNEEMARQALRVLAAAYKPIESIPGTVDSETLEKDLVFVGMVGMIDPPREEARVAVQKCRTAGIKPVMITGDHKITAVAIAEYLDIKRPEDKAITGLELQKMSDAQLKSDVDSISVYARVSPEDKVRIVKAFQENDKIVAMTGDGVNDAPALKLANIGVAMGVVGTDVAKEAADVVLTDDNFATIVSAVEEGRRIYDNILKAIQFLLSTNIGEVIVLFVAVMLNWATPLLPIHILWINLVTDSLPALALSVDPAAPDIMQRKPLDSRKGIMTRPFTIRILLQGLMIGGLSLIAYRIGLRESVELAQTMTFGVLGMSQITLVLCVRSGSHSAFRVMFNNKYLWGAIIIVSAMMLGVMEIPALFEIFHVVGLNGEQWLWVALLSLAPLAITELAKLSVRLFSKNKDNK